MSKLINVIAILCAFVAIAFGVFKAGELAMSGEPILALIPVGILLTSVVIYIRWRDKKD
jgi:hypothetical protein